MPLWQWKKVQEMLWESRVKEAGVSEVVMQAMMRSGRERWEKPEVHVYYDPYLPLIRRYYE